jgi:hypothetical protein
MRTLTTAHTRPARPVSLRRIYAPRGRTRRSTPEIDRRTPSGRKLPY